MRAFLSYSLNSQDHYILTLLASELKTKGFSVISGNDFYLQNSSPLTTSQISKSQLFIGIMTGDGDENKRVQREWRIANLTKTPSILLIENTVRLDSKFNSSHIIFDRHHPQLAVEELKKIINRKKNNSNEDSNALSWIIGAAALLAIIGLLSDDK